MDERVLRIASMANVSAYNSAETRKYIEGAPHIKHGSLRLLYGNLLVRVFDHAKLGTQFPRVLDLGAGEGSVTLPFLELGANVTAVDISSSQLDALKYKCRRFGDRLVIRCEDIHKFLNTAKDNRYDIIVANSFLHHIPDYLGMLEVSIPLLSSRGQFFSFQDPCRYDSCGRLTMLFSNVAYLSWRITRGNVFEGLKRRMRRSRGIYIDDSIEDNAEYHVTRNGVDQAAIGRLFEASGNDCEIISYFSTQSRIFQFVGSTLKMNNTFAIIAKKN